MNKQGSQEWFADRKGRITGSIAAALLNISPFMPRWKAAEIVLHSQGDESEQSDNPALIWGKAMEEQAMACLVLDYPEIKPQECGFFPYEHWLGASPDGVTEDAVIEIKCPYGKRDDTDPEFNSIHSDDMKHYYVQIQLEMFCTGMEQCHFYQWTPNGAKYERVVRDNKYLDDLIPKLRQMYDEIHADWSHLEALVTQYLEQKAQIDKLTQDNKHLLGEIVQKSGEREILIGEHRLMKTERQGSISYAKVVKEQLPDIDLEEYRGESISYWSIK